MIYNIMNFTEEENLPGLLLSIDIEKAFGSILWKFIQEVLCCVFFFNFGESLKRWISVLYNNISSSMIQSGFISEFLLFPEDVGKVILCLHIFYFFVPKYCHK